MFNTTTHYQTSFRAEDAGDDSFIKLKASVYGWIVEKEPDRVLRERKSEFFFRWNRPQLYQTGSSIVTDSFIKEGGAAWALRYTEVDRECGRKRFWFSDVGLRKVEGAVVVSVRISFAWNSEDLSHEQEAPRPTVPKLIRYILQDNQVYSGRPEYKLIDKPIPFSSPGSGKALCDFIQSAERRYPLIVFNGDFSKQMREANSLARELTGKCQVAVVANNIELAEEIKLYLPADYRVPFGQFRVFFPFHQKRNSPFRHRWYDCERDGYEEQRHGIINGLLRNHSLLEAEAVESVDDITRLITRESLIRLRESNPGQKKELDEFFGLYDQVEKERDQFKNEAAAYAAQVDEKEDEIRRLNDERADEVRRLKWECNTYQSKLEAAAPEEGSANVSALLPSLPSTLPEVAEAASRCFPRLVITEQALKSAKDYIVCRSVNEAWEMLRHLNGLMYRLKFEEEDQRDWERVFQDETGYELAMSEGRNTKKDRKLMDLRKLQHGGAEYDITPHLKYGNQEPKMVRVHFAFDESRKKIMVGYIGPHMENATSRKV